jgi:response regulator of citrate/malate metabolism
MQIAVRSYEGLAERIPRGLGKQDPAETVLAGAVEALREMEDFGAWDFAAAAGISRRSAQRYLSRLLVTKRVIRLGAGRATRYRVAGG